MLTIRNSLSPTMDTVTDILNTTDADLDKPSYLYKDKGNHYLIATYTLAIFGVPGNLLTIVVLLSSHHLRAKPINRFLVHQSTLDLCACILTFMEELTSKYPVMHSPFLCHYILSKILSGSFMFMSTYNVVVLTIERYLAISDPLKYDSAKVLKRLPFVFVAIWIFVFSVTSIVPATTVIKNGVCLLGYRARNHWLLTYYGYHALFFAMVFPLIILIYCYARMIVALRRSMNMSAVATKQIDGSDSSVHKSRLAQYNIFETCLIITILFVLCWTTNETGLFLYVIGVYPNLATDHYSIGRLLVLLNSCLNPFVYALRYDEFKKQLRVLLRCTK